MIKPYLWTLWDLFHLDHPEFPELRTSGKFEARENFNYRCLRKAAAVVVDSPQLAEKATEAFGAKKEKFVVVPYSIPKTRKVDDLKDSELPVEIRGIAGQYFFYPAQLWSHKNHQRIVEAIRELHDSGKDVHAVFVGRDHGAGAALEAKIRTLGIAHRIHILGYVHDNAIPALYRESLGLVMASYVGPNIPPLEAMNLGVPIIATNIHKNQLSDAALYFDPDNAQELVEKMVAISDPKTRQRLISASKIRLRELDENRNQGNLKLRDQIQRISRRIMKA
jgi:glycosyltransferase involved in cell wall biosynthesis